MQIALLTAKLAILPKTSPATRQKLATVAATSTSATRPLSFGLCSTEGAAIIQRLETHPFDHPKVKRMQKNAISELMKGGVGSAEEGRCTLHRRNRGIKRTRAKEMARIRDPDQTIMNGNEQAYLPRKSPRLKTRKWIALKSSGWVAGLVGCTDSVIGG